jgi:hypothetical protein
MKRRGRERKGLAEMESVVRGLGRWLMGRAYEGLLLRLAGCGKEEDHEGTGVFSSFFLFFSLFFVRYCL